MTRVDKKAKSSAGETERILTLHPEKGKAGVRIDKRKYDAMAKALLKVIPKREPGVLFGELKDRVRPHLPKSVFTEGVSVAWYVVTVKLDLEARGSIVRVGGRGPQRVVRA